jgi:hypothetical protein
VAEDAERGLPPAGFYTDPSGSDRKRWWDGETWGELQELPEDVVSAEPPPLWHHQHKVIEEPPPRDPSPRGWGALAEKNGSAISTLVISLIYVVLGATFHIVFFGILPIFTALASYRRREFLWPVAAAAAVGTLVFSLSALHR